VWYDVTPPAVTITKAVWGQEDPTNNTSIHVAVHFSEIVDDFTADDVVIGGTATSTPSVEVVGSRMNYELYITGFTGEGTVTIGIPAGIAHDDLGNPNTAAETQTITLDMTPPTLTVERAATQGAVTGAAVVHFTVQSSEPLWSLRGPHMDLSESTAPGPLMAQVTGTGPLYNIAVSGMSGAGTVVAKILGNVVRDVAGNFTAASTNTDNVVTYIISVGPTADAGGPYAMDEGGSVQLDGSGSAAGVDEIVSYAWDFDGDGEYDEATGVSPVFSAVGLDGPSTVTVSLLVTDSIGDTATDQTVVTVRNVAPIADAGGPYRGSRPSTIILDASASRDPGNDIATYDWDFDGDGEYDDATGISPVFPTDAFGVFVVGLRVTDADHASGTATATVIVNGVVLENTTVEENEVTTIGHVGFIEPDGGSDQITAIHVSDSRFEVLYHPYDPGGEPQTVSPYYLDFVLVNLVGLDHESEDTVAVEITIEGHGWSVSDTVEITVLDVAEPPTVTQAIPNQAGEENLPFEFVLDAGTFADEDEGDYVTCAITLGDGSALPAWLNRNDATQTLSGTPLLLDRGQFEVKVTATDTSGLTAEARFTITIAADPHPWQNPTDPFDVDGRNGAEPIDVLIVINFLNGGGRGPLPEPPSRTAVEGRYVDVDGNNWAEPLDVLLVINIINGSVASRGGEAEVAAEIETVEGDTLPGDARFPWYWYQIDEVPSSEQARRGRSVVYVANITNASSATPARAWQAPTMGTARRRLDPRISLLETRNNWRDTMVVEEGWEELLNLLAENAGILESGQAW
jgi:hypothetical protein